MDYINRNNYLEKLIRLQNTPDIKVITGIRRCGKSVLLKQFIEYLKLNDKSVNIISINLQDLEYDSLLDYHNLHSYIMDKYIKSRHNVLLIDEVQLCNKFELAINSLHEKNIFDIYLTGSNAFLLSSDLATLFTGRVMKIEVFPFSFSEYLDYFGSEEQFDSMFNKYLKIGGMPGTLVYSNENDKFSYLLDVYETILLRDLVDKYKIRNKNELQHVSNYMIDNVGNLLSPNNICISLNKDNSSITRKTVSKYISYFENSFMFYKAKRYDLKGKKYLVNNDKYYLADTGFKYSINGTKSMDYGRALENIVFIELLRRGYEVYVGMLYRKEIDFVAIRRDEKIYIQVSDYLDNPSTFEREYSPLLSIKDAYPKMIIARTHHDEYTYEGIRIVDAARWLLGEK